MTPQNNALVDTLLYSFDIVVFMETHGYKMRHVGKRTGYITKCPYCLKDDHLGINPKSGKFGCYKCKKAGTFAKLIGKISKKSFTEVLEYLKDGADDSIIDINAVSNVLDRLKTVETSLLSRLKPCVLPQGYQSLYNRRIPYLDNGRKYPIPQDQVNYYRMGFCPYGKFRNRLVICDVDEQQQPIYWVARDTSGTVPKSWKVLNPTLEHTALGSSDILFNFSLAKNYSTIIITEGVFDALYIGNNAVCTYGVGLKNYHLYWLLQCAPELIVLMYDADVKMEVLEKYALELSMYFPVKICQLPSGDPDEYTHEQLSKFIEETPLFHPSRLYTVCPDLNVLKREHKWT